MLASLIAWRTSLINRPFYLRLCWPPPSPPDVEKRNTQRRYACVLTHAPGCRHCRLLTRQYAAHDTTPHDMKQVKDKDEKTLTYAQFAAGLNIVAVTLFPEVHQNLCVTKVGLFSSVGGTTPWRMLLNFGSEQRNPLERTMLKRGNFKLYRRATMT